MTKLIMAAALLAATNVYRLELDTETEKLHLVGSDGVRRECCIIDPDSYAILTGRVDQVWQSLNRTSDGRVKLHGKIVRQEVADNVKTEVHEDGYRFSFKLQPKRQPRMVVTKAVRSTSAPALDLRVSERQRKMRERVREALSGKVREVTVEHDAATGKDVVK